MRPFTGFPDEQRCALYNIDGRLIQAKTERQVAGRLTLGVATTSRWPQQLIRERSWTEHPPPH